MPLLETDVSRYPSPRLDGTLYSTNTRQILDYVFLRLQPSIEENTRKRQEFTNILTTAKWSPWSNFKNATKEYVFFTKRRLALWSESAVRAAVDMLKHTQALEGLPASLQPFPVGRSVRYSDRGGAIMFHVKKRPNIFISVRGHEAFRFRRFSSLLSLRALFL